ncbi:MAG: hypothetical protein ACRD3C_00815 [Vicinamibacterales bacterium]
MRLMPLVSAALLLLASGPSFAQNWAEYNSRRDFFSVNFPGEPQIRDVTYTSEYGLTLPGRVYSVTEGQNSYSVTVIDYSGAEKMHTERAAKCKAAGGDGDSCGSPGRADVRGAIVYSSWSFIKRGSEVTHYANYNADLVEGHRLQLLNKDGSRTFAVVHMHDYRLFILEGTVTRGLPPPALFQQSLGFLDKDGNRIRYETTYSHGYPIPRRTR